MGLSAVPFGTAQVHGEPTGYKIEVEKKETDKSRYFSIDVKCFSEEKCFLRPEVIEIDWPKSNDAVPVRVSKHDAKSIFRFCDVVTKKNATLYYNNKKLVRGLVHVLSFWVREFPFFKFGDSFSERLRCDLIFNLHPGEKQETLWVVEKRYVDYTVVNVVSDIPTFPQSLNEAMLINNHLCFFR